LFKHRVRIYLYNIIPLRECRRQTTVTCETLVPIFAYGVIAGGLRDVFPPNVATPPSRSTVIFIAVTHETREIVRCAFVKWTMRAEDGATDACRSRAFLRGDTVRRLTTDVLRSRDASDERVTAYTSIYSVFNDDRSRPDRRKRRDCRGGPPCARVYVIRIEARIYKS